MTDMNAERVPIETERKFLIRLPSDALLCAQPGCEKSEITQTYLINPAAVERVRKRVYTGRVVYTHTVKRRISAMSAQELEREISESEYDTLLLRRDPARRAILKTRYAIPHGPLVAEVDVYPFWQRQAVLEIELPSEDAPFDFPEYLSLIREVTGDHSYSNNQLSLKIPKEDLTT